MKPNANQKNRASGKKPFLERMVDNAEPVLISVAVAFVVVATTLLISLSYKLP